MLKHMPTSIVKERLLTVGEKRGKEGRKKKKKTKLTEKTFV